MKNFIFLIASRELNTIFIFLKLFFPFLLIFSASFEGPSRNFFPKFPYANYFENHNHNIFFGKQIQDFFPDKILTNNLQLSI